VNLYLTYTYKLVKSLSPSEKGYVKKYFNNQSRRQSSFIELIDYLDTVENINELKSNETDVLVKHTIISEDCFYALLNAIEKYHSSSSKEIRKNLNIIEILTEKNLPNQLDKVIAKSKTLADKEKKYNLYAEICDWEIAILGQKPPTEKTLKAFEQIFDSLEKRIGK
jgi:hypothetical protein